MIETYVIHVTKECNMKCVYCYEKDKVSTYTWEEIRSFLDDLILRSPDEFQIEFLGGEPMLRWDLIRNTYEYMERISYKTVTSYGITTNGTILNEEIMDYLYKNKKFGFNVSLDGHKFANQLRVMKDNKNSYDIAMGNLIKLLKRKINCSIHIVSHPYNVAMLYDSIVHFYDKGIRSIGIGTVEKTIGIDERYNKRFIEELNRVSIAIITGRLKDLKIGLFENVKPPEDVRCYIRDENGKLIAESYGRSGEDITTDKNYNVIRCEQKDKAVMYIEYIRRKVYDNHQNNLRMFNV